MNRVILCGRLTGEPKVNEALTVARYSLAVDRKFKREGEPTADFFNCVAFGKSAEFVNSYLHKGTKMIIEGRLQNSSYESNGQTVKTTDVIVDNQEFAESKSSQNGFAQINAEVKTDDFMSIPEGFGETLPFD